MVDNFSQQEEDELWGPEDQPELEDQTNENQDDYNEFDEQEEPSEEGDYITRLLKSKNIDRNKIRFQNEDGEIEEYKFDDLSDEDKLAILSEQDELPITDQEIEDLNTLRTQNVNLQEFVNKQKELAIKEYLAQNQTPQYEIDNMSDDQVFVYDLINRYGEDLTDEEIDAELEKAKDNEDLFKKKIGVLRNHYKSIEEANTQQALAQEQAQMEAEKKELQNACVSAAIDLKEINGVTLEDTDRNEILDFLLAEDENHRTQFSSLLSDPKALVKLAWYTLHGDEVYEATVNYYKGKIAEARNGGKPKTKTIIKKEQDTESDPYDLDKVFKRK